MRPITLILSGISGAMAVSLGALGAHQLKQTLPTDLLHSFETASEYQIFHTLVLLICAFVIKPDSKLGTAIITLFGFGILLFSGSIYLLSTSEILGISNWKSWLGPITPIGGLLFIAGWSCLAVYGIQFYRNDKLRKI